MNNFNDEKVSTWVFICNRKNWYFTVKKLGRKSFIAYGKNNAIKRIIAKSPAQLEELIVNAIQLNKIVRRNPMIDLLGNEQRRVMKASGFAASNGTGPHGEKCKTCNFCQHRWQVFKLIRVKSWHPDYTKQQKYFCTLTKGQINSTAAACALWEKKDE